MSHAIRLIGTGPGPLAAGSSAGFPEATLSEFS